MNYKISIIIPFYYSEKKIIGTEEYFPLLSFDKCLSSIFKSKYKKYEVILVSDNSSQSSIELTKRYPCKVIELKNNFGAAYSRNQGTKYAKGQILLFVDSDVEIRDDALSIINKYNNKKNNHGIMQGVYSNKPIYKNSITQYLHSYQCYHLFLEKKKKKLNKTFFYFFFLY